MHAEPDNPFQYTVQVDHSKEKAPTEVGASP